MSENDSTKEVRRLCNLVSKIAELAEHVEQTGSFESGAQNSVKRYNVVVERLEQLQVITEGMFPKLEEDAKFGQLGAEATLLASYLEEMTEEDEPSNAPTKGNDLGPLVALAPFLGSKELSQLVREHFPKAKLAGESEEETSEPLAPDMKTIVSLAPHMKSADLAGLLQSYLARHGRIDPKYIASLAPHLSSEQLGQMLRDYVPEWFQTQPSEKAEKTPPANGEKSVDWMKDLNNPKPE